MSPAGWSQLLEGPPWCAGEGGFPIAAYSELMPPPRLGAAPCGELDDALFVEEDPFGWRISELEQERELRPGIERLAQQVVGALARLGGGAPEHHIAGHGARNLVGNPCWPPELAAAAGSLAHERYVLLAPLALSRTQDDKGRVRWTFFGGSEQGPERAFWRSFLTAPGAELPASAAIDFLARLLAAAFGETARDEAALRAAGLRLLPAREVPPGAFTPFVIDEHAPLDAVRYLLTFRPFSELPPDARARYLAGRMQLLPFPGSLVFWTTPTYGRLVPQLPLAAQLPLFRLAHRHHAPDGLRVAQSGWLHEPRKGPAAVHERSLLVETFHRTSRWDRVHRHEDELASLGREDKVARVLFSTALDAIGLYDKPLARNCQIWTDDFELVLDGPCATRREILRAADRLREGGLFGYRFQFAPMRVGRHQVFWQRPLVAHLSAGGSAVVVDDAPTGYLAAYPCDGRGAPDLAHAVELWPRLLRRPERLAALQHLGGREHYARQTALNALRLLEIRRLWEGTLDRDFARHLLRIPRRESLDDWLASLPERADDPSAARLVRQHLDGALEPQPSPPPAEALTLEETATRGFEERLWGDIATLAHGRYRNKDNADCIDDPATRRRLGEHCRRDLDALADYLLDRHRQAIAAAGMAGRAQCAAQLFTWRTELEYPHFGGWRRAQGGEHERNVLLLIPGRDRSQAVVMADHYDTAYMEDLYEAARGGDGARVAAAGADDNHSATATLLQAASPLLLLAREGRLARDVWLLHLTGEEFPADCLGARHFCQALVERSLRVRLDSGAELDLGGTRVVGAFVLDMIAHNRESGQDVFQISPGRGAPALRLAREVHGANRLWNARAAAANQRAERRGKGRGQRSADARTLPSIALQPHLHGEIRTPDDPHSSLFNTDGQIFSDVGVPVVLLMENYDINRVGYHDTQDTLANIDLDYGAALAAIAIEAVARVATS
jgi:hypothetical protein